uniref:Thymidylate synthase n=1 Tax=viral metagenome TaxID=1070528 RepID=A0A6C0ICH3_9ZZZZ
MAKTIHLLLDGTGFVELLGSFGDDLTVVNAARVSFAKESKEVTEADKKLIKYLATHGHISPFFHPQVRLRLKMPIFVAREWYRHTIGFARNEVSRRYVDTEPECFNPQELRERDPKLKQGSKANVIVENDDVADYVKKFQDSAIESYNVLLSKGVAPEVARGILPQNMYTEFVETASLYAYARLCRLRLDPHAQKEIREYAAAVSELIAPMFPHSWPWLVSTNDSV